MENYFNFTTTEFSAAVIIFNLLFAFVLGLGISWTYMKTHRGLSYSQSLVFTMVLITVLGSVVMMVVRNNIVGAFALLGAFSLIRFRTIIKDTKDVAYIFFALATGVAVGTNNYVIAIFTTIILSAIIFLLTKYNFGSIVRNGALLVFVADNSFPNEGYKEIFNNHLKSYELLHIKTVSGGSKEYAFAVKPKNEQNLDIFAENIQSLKGVENASVVTGKNATEY